MFQNTKGHLAPYINCVPSNLWPSSKLSLISHLFRSLLYDDDDDDDDDFLDYYGDNDQL